jgi:Uncharacterized conserved protein
MSSANAPFSLALDPSLECLKGLEGVRAALVWGLGLPGCPKTSSAPGYLAALLERTKAAGEAFLDGDRKAAVRGMLRHGKYKPAGRGRPSSEYLLAAALEGNFPLVNGPVDANNAVSLEYGYPASVFDAAKTGGELLLRWGLASEAYVFNPSGQVIDLEDLLVVCRRAGADAWEPCGNPVKDAMATKVFEGARSVVAVVYAPASDEPERLDACARLFCELLSRECGAAEPGYIIYH